MLKSIKSHAVPAIATRLAMPLAALVLSMSFSLGAKATTLDTFSFSLSTSLGSLPFVIDGVFTGTPNAAGFLSLSPDLLEFSNLDSVKNVTPAFFSFDINGGSSSLDFAAEDSSGDVFCVGAAAAFGGVINGVNCGAGGVTGYVNFNFSGQHTVLTAQNFPTISLISSHTVPPTPTPEPSGLVLMAIGLLSVAIMALAAAARDRWLTPSDPVRS
jgi:hypothetical protein